jgi:hypothetical protein
MCPVISTATDVALDFKLMVPDYGAAAMVRLMRADDTVAFESIPKLGAGHTFGVSQGVDAAPPVVRCPTLKIHVYRVGAVAVGNLIHERTVGSTVDRISAAAPRR